MSEGWRVSFKLWVESFEDVQGFLLSLENGKNSRVNLFKILSGEAKVVEVDSGLGLFRLWILAQQLVSDRGLLHRINTRRVDPQELKLLQPTGAMASNQSFVGFEECRSITCPPLFKGDSYF
ncbi:hypothetical protein GQ457_03G001090 [Hibiscus cannabinus]